MAKEIKLKESTLYILADVLINYRIVWRRGSSNSVYFCSKIKNMDDMDADELEFYIYKLNEGLEILRFLNQFKFTVMNICDDEAASDIKEVRRCVRNHEFDELGRLLNELAEPKDTDFETHFA